MEAKAKSSDGSGRTSDVGNAKHRSARVQVFKTERTDLNGAEALIGVESPAVSSEGAPPIGARPGTEVEVKLESNPLFKDRDQSKLTRERKSRKKLLSLSGVSPHPQRNLF